MISLHQTNQPETPCNHTTFFSPPEARSFSSVWAAPSPYSEKGGLSLGGDPLEETRKERETKKSLSVEEME